MDDSSHQPESSQADQRQVVADDLTCRDCGHALAGLTLNDKCSNCELPVVWSIRHASPGYTDIPGGRRNAARVLQHDLLCRSCGYNLRGLSREHDCPECGTAVRWSVGGFMLDYADPVWLKKLLRGSSLLMASVYTLMLIGALLLLVAMLKDRMNATWPDRLKISSLVAMWIDLVLVLYAVGTWKLTVAEPRERESGSALSLRMLARMTSVIGPLVLGIVLSLWAIDDDHVPATGWIVALIGGIVSHLLFIDYMIILAKRMRTRIHGRYMRTYQVVFGLVSVGMLWIAIINSGDFPDESCCCGSLIGFGGAFFFSIWFLSVAFDLNDAIKTALLTSKDESA